MVLRAGASHYEPVDLGRGIRADRRGTRTRSVRPTRRRSTPPGRTSNEAAFLYQLFARQFGTNNLPDCSNMCHESSGEALNEAIGRGKGTVTLEDFELADAIFVIGQNPGTNHPRMLDDPAGGGPPRLPDRQRQSAVRSGLNTSSTRRSRWRCWARAHRSLHCICRCGSTATWRFSKAS